MCLLGNDLRLSLNTGRGSRGQLIVSQVLSRELGERLPLEDQLLSIRVAVAQRRHNHPSSPVNLLSNSP